MLDSLMLQGSPLPTISGREVESLSSKAYQVSGVVIDKYDMPHYFDVQVVSASVDGVKRKLRSILGLRRGDLLRDVMIKEIS